MRLMCAMSCRLKGSKIITAAEVRQAAHVSASLAVAPQEEEWARQSVLRVFGVRLKVAEKNIETHRLLRMIYRLNVNP